MDNDHTIAPGEAEQLQDRLMRLAKEKAHLQLFSNILMTLARVSGLENKVRHAIVTLMDAIGGSNVILYYRFDGDWYTSDINEAPKKIAGIDNPLVEQAMETRRFIESEYVEEQSDFYVKSLSHAMKVWVFPLIAGDNLIGALQMDGIMLEYTAEIKRELGIIVDYLSLALSNEIINSSKLKVAYDALKTESKKLVKEVVERKRTEAALRELNQFNKEIIDSAQEGIIVYDHDMRYLLWNPFMERLSGASAQDVIGRHPLTVFPFLKDAGVIDGIERALAGETPAAIDYSYPLGNTGLSGWVSDQSSPLRNAKGEIIGVIAIVSDITERKRAEVEQEELQTQLIQAHKMESVGRLAGGVAHDFNNMLTIILAQTEMSLLQMDADQPLAERLREIHDAAKRSATLTRQLLTFARKETISPRVLDLNKTFEGMLSMLRRLIGEDIDLAWFPAAALWPVKMDASQIDQVLANLCVNARDAIGGIGKVTIETRNVTVDADYCRSHAGFVPGDYVMMVVGDDGCGMDKETCKNLFEPFFTTKGLGQGTGLGMSTVYGIVKQNNGFVYVYSEPGKGTSVKIYLPRYGGKTVSVQKESVAELAASGHETILLVEDEFSILKVTSRMLERLGYTVLAATRPNEAIRMAETHAREISLLMTDIVMPEMNGRDLANILLSRYPDLKCLFMSGYTADVIAHHGVLDEGVYFIQKPFAMVKLAGKLREVLEAN